MTLTAREATLALLASRSLQASVCPSEVARLISSNGNWRGHMADVHAAVDELVEQGLVTLSWKRKPLEKRTGPYRIGRPAPDKETG